VLDPSLSGVKVTSDQRRGYALAGERAQGPGSSSSSRRLGGDLHARNDVGEIGKRVDRARLARRDERVEPGDALAGCTRRVECFELGEVVAIRNSLVRSRRIARQDRGDSSESTRLPRIDLALDYNEWIASCTECREPKRSRLVHRLLDELAQRLGGRLRHEVRNAVFTRVFAAAARLRSVLALLRLRRGCERRIPIVWTPSPAVLNCGGAANCCTGSPVLG
jgi:hypothetical protein